MFKLAADFMAHMVIRKALLLGKEKMSDLPILYATFTLPVIAHMRLYKSDTKEKHMHTDCLAFAVEQAGEYRPYYSNKVRARYKWKGCQQTSRYPQKTELVPQWRSRDRW